MSRAYRMKRKQEKRRRQRTEKRQWLREQHRQYGWAGPAWGADDDENDSWKLSARLQEIWQPYEELIRDERSADFIISMAASAWTLTVFEAEKRADLLEAMLQENCGEDPAFHQTAHAMITTMMQRKLRLFPDDRRAILDYRCRYDAEGGGLHLVVIGTLVPEGASCASATA